VLFWACTIVLFYLTPKASLSWASLLWFTIFWLQAVTVFTYLGRSFIYWSLGAGVLSRPQDYEPVSTFRVEVIAEVLLVAYFERVSWMYFSPLDCSQCLDTCSLSCACQKHIYLQRAIRFKSG